MNRELFKELVDRYNAGQATAREKAFIEAYYAGFEVRPDIIDELSPSEQLKFEELLYQDILSAAVSADPSYPKQKITPDTEYTRPIHRVHFRRRWGSAAAVIVLLGAGAYLWAVSKKAEQPLANGNKASQTDIQPGTNKAILRLADGTVIALDSAANGQLAQQSGSNLIKRGGQVIYENADHLHKNGKTVGSNTLSTPNGGQYQITLPDGTRVWLNASSSITFPTAFAGAERAVKIKGEIYFEVAKNKQKPFVIDIDGNSSVEVLGTSFNINSYADEGTIKTTLLEGSIKVIKEDREVVLSPGQQAATAIVRASDQPLKVINNPDVEQALAWKNGIFNFNGSNFNSVARQLERWYDIKIKYEAAVPHVIFKGEMNRGVKLSTVLEWFSDLNINTRLEGKILIVLK
jgi:transmembrane sensor